MEVIEVAHLWARPWKGGPGGPARIIVEGGHVARIEPGGAGRGLALPGLVNAHDHARGVRPLAAGAADGPLEEWLWRLRRVPAVDPWLNAAVAFGRMALSGVVAVADLHLPADPTDPSEGQAVARAARDVGVSLAFVAPLVDRNVHGLDGGAAAQAALGADWARVEQALPPLADQIAAAEAIPEDDGVALWYGPAGPHWVTEAGWEEVAARSAATGRRVHTHLLETVPQRAWLDGRHGGDPLGWMERAGLLNDRLVVAHGVHLRPEECERLAGAGATLAINASSNLRLASGIAPGAAIRAAGLPFGLGLDGLALGDDEDMLAEMRLAAALLGGWGHGRTGPSAADLWRAACADGWRAIIGRARDGIAVGAPADILVLDEAALAPDALEGLTPELVLARARRSAVRSVHARGRRIVSEGRVLGLDLPALEAELLAQARALTPFPDLAALLDRAALATALSVRQAPAAGSRA